MAGYLRSMRIWSAALRELADEFQMSPSLVRNELQQLYAPPFRIRFLEGSKPTVEGAALWPPSQPQRWRITAKGPLPPKTETSMAKGIIEAGVDSIIQRFGNLQETFLIHDYAEGKDTGIIDLVLVGEVDPGNLDDLVKRTERYIERKIRTLALTPEEYIRLRPALDQRPRLPLWSAEPVTARVA